MAPRSDQTWPFEDPPGAVAVTTKHVTERKLPILYVSHDLDEAGEATWQFHCLVEPFSLDDAQLVRLDSIVEIDSSVLDLADLPVGYAATRAAPGSEWRRYREE